MITKKNELNLIESEPKSDIHSNILGDVNNDNIFNGADVVFLASWVANIDHQVQIASNDPNFLKKADVNKDGIVNGSDVVYMASAVAGIEGYSVANEVIEHDAEPEPEPEPEQEVADEDYSNVLEFDLSDTNTYPIKLKSSKEIEFSDRTAINNLMGTKYSYLIDSAYYSKFTFIFNETNELSLDTVEERGSNDLYIKFTENINLSLSEINSIVIKYTTTSSDEECVDCEVDFFGDYEADDVVPDEPTDEEYLELTNYIKSQKTHNLDVDTEEKITKINEYLKENYSNFMSDHVLILVGENEKIKEDLLAIPNEGEQIVNQVFGSGNPVFFDLISGGDLNTIYTEIENKANNGSNEEIEILQYIDEINILASDVDAIDDFGIKKFNFSDPENGIYNGLNMDIGKHHLGFLRNNEVALLLQEYDYGVISWYGLKVYNLTLFEYTFPNYIPVLGGRTYAIKLVTRFSWNIGKFLIKRVGSGNTDCVKWISSPSTLASFISCVITKLGSDLMTGLIYVVINAMIG